MIFFVLLQQTILAALMCCSSTQRRRAFAGRHVFVLASSSGLRGHKRTYRTIIELADRALFKMVRYVFLRPLRPELDAKTKTCLPAITRFCHLDEQAITLTRAKAQNKTKNCGRLVTPSISGVAASKPLIYSIFSSIIRVFSLPRASFQNKSY
jgi:hypothetical protein